MDVRRPIELVQAGFEVAGILVLVLGTVFALISSAAALVRRVAGPTGYQVLRQHLGRAILLGLEFLVAADIIRSVALDLTFASIGILGLLVTGVKIVGGLSGSRSGGLQGDGVSQRL